jgi:hypothetical protein
LKCLDGFFFFFSLLSHLKRIRDDFDFDIIDAHCCFIGAFL